MAEWWEQYSNEYYKKNGIDPETGNVSRETSTNDTNASDNEEQVGKEQTPQLSQDGTGVRIDENGNPSIYIVLDDPNEALNTPPPEPPQLKPIDDVDLEAKTLLLDSKDVSLPDSVRPKSWWEKNSNTILDFLHNFNRPNAAVLGGAIDFIEQGKDKLKDLQQKAAEGRLLENETPAENLRYHLESAGEVVDNMKAGFFAKREEAPTGRDLIKSIVGEDNVKSAEDFFNKWSDLTSMPAEEMAKNIQDGKMTYSQAMLGLAGSGALGSMQRLFGKEHKDKISPWALKNAMEFGVYLPVEIATDPLTYIPFGLPAKMVSRGTSGVLKGGLKGIAKISPELAETVVKNADRAGKVIEDAYLKYWKSWVYPKGAAEQSAAKVLGAENAATLIDDIHTIAHSPTGATEKVVKGLNDIVKAPTKVGIVRKGIKTAFDKLGYTPENRLTKYLAGMEDSREWLKQTTEKLRTINDGSSAILAPSLAEETQKTISKLLDGSATDEEIDQITKAFQDRYAPKPKTTEQIVEQLKPSGMGSLSEEASKKIDLDQVEQFKKVDDVKTSFVSGMKGANRKAFELAKARRDLRLRQLDERYGVIKDTLGKTTEQMGKVQDELKANMDWLTAKTKQTTQVEMLKRTRIIQRQLQEGITSIKNQASDAIEALKSAEVPKGTQLDRTRYFKNRDAQIAKIKLETEKQLNSIKNYYAGELESSKKSLQKEAEDFYKEQAQGISNEYNKRLENVKYGIPDEKHLSTMYEKAQADILSQFKGESKFFAKELRKVKFFDAYNNMLTAKADTFAKIFEKNIKDLPEEYQILAKTVRDVMDGLAVTDVNTGKLKAFSPNYFPRFAVAGEEGLNVISKDQFETGLRAMMQQGSGLSKFTKDRVAADYGSFLKALDKRGLKPIDDIYEIVYNRVLSSKKEQAYHEILSLIPDVIKTTETGGNATKYVRDYIKGLYEGGEVFNNLAKRKFYKAYTNYNYWNKALLTAVSPIFHATNAMSAPFMTATKAGLKAYNPVTYLEAVGIKTGALKTITNDVGEKMAVKEFMEAGQKYGGLSSSFASADFKKTVDRVLNRYSKSDPRYWVVKSVGFGQQVEELNRAHAAYVFWKDGKPLREAWKLSRDTQFDYADTNNFTKAVNGILAFFTWNAKNLPAQVKSMANDPKQFSILANLYKSINAGKLPNQEDLALLNDRDKAQLWVYGQTIEGMQEAQKMGFMPIQEAFGDVKNLSQGDIEGFLESKANFLNPMAKSFIKWAYNAIRPPYDPLDPKNQELPENLTHVISRSPKAITTIDKLSKFFTGDHIKVIDKPVWRNGEQKMEKRIVAPPVVYEFLSSNPLARVLSETGQMIKVAGKNRGPNEAGISEMISDGASAEDILKFLFGVKYKQFHYDAMYDQLKRKQLREVEGLLKKHQMMGTFNYLKKDVKDQYKAMRTYVKERQAQ